MLKLEMLPSGHGDCLWIEYGDVREPRRVLIDGGTKGTYKRALRPKLGELDENERRFELLVITHIDADHIAGVLELLSDETASFAADDIWFNGYRHLPDEAPDTLGPVQGEKLTDLLVRPGVQWNGAFGGGAVVVPGAGELPRFELEGGLVLTLLSPTPDRLTELKPEWEKEVLKAGLDPDRLAPPQKESPEGFQLLGAGPPDVDSLAAEPFVEDTSAANGSSIALLAEYEGHSILLAGDAYASVLKASIERLGSCGNLTVDAFKLPHHGSKANIDRDLLQALECDTYLFSTNGAYFKHPDHEAVARVIKWGGRQRRLSFNYRSKYNSVWEAKPLRDEYQYNTAFPESGSEGLAFSWP